MATTLTNLVTKMQTCATGAGFNTFKFGKLEHINFDHSIKYDLLNLQYPSSKIYDLNSSLQVYTCQITAARPFSSSNQTAVQYLDNVHLIMTSLEQKLWSFLSCVASADCNNVIPKDAISITRDKGTFNDNLVTLDCTFNIEVFVDCFDVDCNKPYVPVSDPTQVTYNCVSGNCIDPGDGSGVFTGSFALKDCQTSGCLVIHTPLVADRGDGLSEDELVIRENLDEIEEGRDRGLDS
jgi:hypothetical protein